MKHILIILLTTVLIGLGSETSYSQTASAQNTAQKRDGGRKILYKCKDFQRAADWHESGIAVIKVCINEAGLVESAEFQRSKSANFSPSMVKILTDCASKYIYEPEKGAPTVCGEIVLRFGMN